MKQIKYILITVAILFAFTIKVDAANVTIKKNYNSITQGGYVTVTSTVSSESPIVSIEGTLSCTGSGSGTVSMNFDDMSNSLYSKTFSVTVKGNSIGNITCSINGVRITNMSSADWQYLGNQSTTIKVVAPKTYSSNNNLSALAVEGYELTPTFDKNTLEYNLEVPNEIRTVNITATKEDNTATISGLGEKSLMEGPNRIEIVVTAENGTTKTYIINIMVKELDPIIVEVDGKHYTVVRKKEQLTVPTTFSETTTKINEFEVPALENKKLNYTLVGLKDEKGNINLYIYDINNNKYTLYNERTFQSLTIYVLDDSSQIPKGYAKTNLKLENENIIAYKSHSNSKYYLFYGVNVETGKKNLYLYDSEEKTLQRYNSEENSKIKSDEPLYQYIIISLGSVLIVTYLIILVVLIKKNSKKKKKNKKIKRRQTNDEINEED